MASVPASKHSLNPPLLRRELSRGPIQEIPTGGAGEMGEMEEAWGRGACLLFVIVLPMPPHAWMMVEASTILPAIGPANSGGQVAQKDSGRELQDHSVTRFREWR
jgi:hypothetical protein